MSKNDALTNLLPRIAPHIPDLIALHAGGHQSAQQESLLLELGLVDELGLTRKGQQFLRVMQTCARTLGVKVA